jgi:hypothetical protein
VITVRREELLADLSAGFRISWRLLLSNEVVGPFPTVGKMRETVRFTVPVKLLMFDVVVIWAAADVFMPGRIVAESGETARSKSGFRMVSETRAKWVVVPKVVVIVPVTLTVYEPGGVERVVETLKFALWLVLGVRVNEVWLRVAVGRFAMVVFETVGVARLMVIVVLLWAVSVMVELSFFPEKIRSEFGLATVAKSGGLATMFNPSFTALFRLAESTT